MAKVVAPLGSFSASGKIGKALVFFGHLGRNVVRGLVSPANPQSAFQGDSRLLLGALGRASRALVVPSDAYNDLKTVTPAGQTWVSYLISESIAFYGSGQTGVDALVAAASGHTKAAVFTARATTLGLSSVIIPYATDEDTIGGGAQLYALAAHIMRVKATNPTLFNRTPYTTALASWTTANISSFVTDITTVA